MDENLNKILDILGDNLFLYEEIAQIIEKLYDFMDRAPDNLKEHYCNAIAALERIEEYYKEL
jgi:hypothetical protein